MNIWMAAGLLGFGMMAAQGDSTFVVQARPALWAGVAAFPSLTAGGGVTPEVAAGLNAALARQNTRVAAAAADCRRTAQKARRHADPAAWQRTVDVTMAGPHYLSLLATDADDCGVTLAHRGVVLPLVYDLTTGAPVSWEKLMPAGVRASLATGEDGTRLNAVEWPVLQARATRQATPECRELILENGILDFAIWLDGAKGAIVAETVSFPNAGAACEVPITFSLDEARQMGFAKELVDALATAQAATPVAK